MNRLISTMVIYQTALKESTIFLGPTIVERLQTRIRSLHRSEKCLETYSSLIKVLLSCSFVGRVAVFVQEQ
jgi:hypothetical protein